jgi:SAM-dependent methyltransferase
MKVAAAQFSTTSQAFFDSLYQKSRDPWSFATSTYETGRYDAIVQALRGRSFHRAFEPGCSIGVLTERLAAFCRTVEAIEISPVAADEARRRTGHLPGVKIECKSLPEAIPDGVFDLIVFSEIGYYFDEIELDQLCRRLLSHLSGGGVFLAAHWLGHSPDHLLSGDRVHQILGLQPELRLDLADRYSGFRLDRWIRA